MTTSHEVLPSHDPRDGPLVTALSSFSYSTTQLIIYQSTVTIIVFLYHDTTVKILLLLTLLIKLYPSLRILLRYLGVLTILVSAMARKFMQGRHPNW